MTTITQHAKEIVAKNLQILLDRNGKTQVDIIRDCGLRQSSVSDYLTAKKYPRPDKMQILADYFNVLKSQITEEQSELEYIGVVPTSIRIPVYGTIPAGVPLEAIEDVLDTEEVPAAWGRGGKEYFALRVKGKSMEPEYLDNDTVIFLKTPVCDNGTDCCVMVNGNDATFKRVFLRDDGITLQPLNATYEAKFYGRKEIEELPVEVLGVVKELRRTK